MFRAIARSFALAAMLVPLVASARTVPLGVNLHNGYLLIINHVKYEDGFSVPGVVRVNDVEEVRVGSGGSVAVNRCCIVAGTAYQVDLDYKESAGAMTPVAVVPQLCSIRGIPFGYAVVVYWGVIGKTPDGSGVYTRFHDTDRVQGRQAHEGCPTEL